MSGPANTLDKATLQEYLLKDAPRLGRYIASKIPRDLGDLTSPDDIMQEVWITAFRGLSSFRADRPDALARWITTIANRRLIDAFRATRALKRRGRILDVKIADHRRSSMIELFDCVSLYTHTPSSEISQKETVGAVQLALASLPEDRRRAIWMRHLDGYSVAEIARKMQKTVPAVHSLLFRARKELAEHLGRASRFFSGGPSSAKAAKSGARSE